MSQGAVLKNKKCLVQLSPCPIVWCITWYGFLHFFSESALTAMEVEIKCLANLGTRVLYGLVYCCEIWRQFIKKCGYYEVFTKFKIKKTVDAMLLTNRQTNKTDYIRPPFGGRTMEMTILLYLCFRWLSEHCVIFILVKHPPTVLFYGCKWSFTIMTGNLPWAFFWDKRNNLLPHSGQNLNVLSTWVPHSVQNMIVWNKI